MTESTEYLDSSDPETIKQLGAKAKLFLDALKASKELGIGLEEEQVSDDDQELQAELVALCNEAIVHPQDVDELATNYLKTGRTSLPEPVVID